MPAKSNLRIDKLLTNLSVKYRNEEYIASQLMPFINVMQDTGQYRVYDRTFKIPDAERAPGSKANEIHFDYSFSTYRLQWRALKDYVSDDDMSQADASDLRADTTEELTDRILQILEKDVSDLYTTTNWSLNVSLAAANAWNANTTVSNPIPIVDTGCSTVLLNSGKMCNVGAIGHDGFIACKNHVSVLDRTKYVSSQMTKTMLAALFDVGELLVSRQVVDTAAPGLAPTMSYLWGDVCWVGFRENRPGLKKASAGYIFRQSKPFVKRWRDEERESDAIEVNLKTQARIVASLAGYLIKDIT